ncbi:MAG: 30S ribosomal protein S20 [Chlamydiae bacterium]|nr:30S ribosomal protein S20 [Chlamydiota bacterium]
MAEEKKEKQEKVPTARKRDLQSKKRRLNNRAFKSRIKGAVHSYERHILDKDMEGAKNRLSEVFSLLDKGVKTHVFKLNKASRYKAKLMKLLPK